MASIVILFAGALLVRVGQALYVAGVSRSKNAAGAVFRIVLDFCIVLLATWAVGFAILAGFEWRLLFGWDLDEQAHGKLAMYLSVVLVGTGLLPAAIGERSRLVMVCIGSVVLGALLIPLGGFLATDSDGWMRRLGFIDFGGASFVHLSAAVFATTGALLLGPRTGKYNRDGSSNMIPGHSMPLAGVGALVMAVGWLPYLLGAYALFETFPSGTALNALVAGSAGGLVSVIFTRLRYGKPDLLLFYSGLLGGLVAVTAVGGLVNSLAACAIGAVAGLLVPLATTWLDLSLKIDDPSGLIAVHGMGGLWGTIAAGIFIGDTFTERLRQGGIQAVGAVGVAILALVLGLAAFGLLRASVGLRVKEADEYDGLDLAEHDLNAYPDFHQTMIKSYHLREA